MPQTPTPNMNLVQPSENGDAGTWDTILSVLFLLIDAHEHSAGKGVKVKPAGLDMNADLTMASGGVFSAIKDCKILDLEPRPASEMTSYAGLFLNSSDANNLYCRTAAGTNVRILNGTTLDASQLGGFLGDYASAGARADYTSASDTYGFKKPTPNNWARVQAGAIRISDYNTTESTYVELAVPTAAITTYSITLPAAAPAANGTLMQYTSTGVGSFSNTGLTATTFASNQHVTVSGTGEYKHGDRTLVIPSPAAEIPAASGFAFNLGGFQWISAAGGDDLFFPVSLQSGKRIKQVDIWYQRSGGTITFDLRRQTLSTGTINSIASTTVNSGTSLTSVSLTSLTHTVIVGEQYHLQVDAGAAGDSIRAVVVTYDHP